MALLHKAAAIASEFEYSKDDARRAIKHFLCEMDAGLQQQESTLSQLPSYVVGLPNGTEKGSALALDVGGTNCRVCEVALLGDSTVTLTKRSIVIPTTLMVANTSKEVFGFFARQIEIFLELHQPRLLKSHRTRALDMSRYYRLGFTLSFAVDQRGIREGKLLRWSKGFHAQAAIGEDVCTLLQDEINALGLPIIVTALVNDTVGTLVTRAYTSPEKGNTLVGCVLGTGTNGAYAEKVANIASLHSTTQPNCISDMTEMVINTEWGAFDSTLRVLPNTLYDTFLDRQSVNPGRQMFEKRVSGMFLGEIMRHALLCLFSEEKLIERGRVAASSRLFQPWGIDTSFLSALAAAHDSGELQVVQHKVAKVLGFESVTEEEAVAIKTVALGIGKRAGRLAGIPIAAVIVKSGRLADPASAASVDVGVDGSLIEQYPQFEEHIRSTLRDIEQIGQLRELRVSIGVVKDGSSVGAALVALRSGGG